MSDIVRKPCLHTAGVTGSNPVPPTKKINDMRHVRVAFSFAVLEKCRKAGLDPRPWQSSGSNTDQSHRPHHISCICLNIAPEPTAEAPPQVRRGSHIQSDRSEEIFCVEERPQRRPRTCGFGLQKWLRLFRQSFVGINKVTAW